MAHIDHRRLIFWWDTDSYRLEIRYQVLLYRSNINSLNIYTFSLCCKKSFMSGTVITEHETKMYSKIIRESYDYLLMYIFTYKKFFHFDCWNVVHLNDGSDYFAHDYTKHMAIAAGEVSTFSYSFVQGMWSAIGSGHPRHGTSTHSQQVLEFLCRIADGSWANSLFLQCSIGPS